MRQPPSSGGGGEVTPLRIVTERELVVVAQERAQLEARRDGVASAAGVDVSPLAAVLEEEGVMLQPLFGVSEARLRGEAAALAAEAPPGETPPDLSVFYRVQAPDERLEALAGRFRELDMVEAAYVKPPTELAMVEVQAGVEGVRVSPVREPAAEETVLHDAVAMPEDAPPVSPDFVARQGYLQAAPGGIDAVYAWTVPGGSGLGTSVIDVEWGWRFTHEDLRVNVGGVVVGTGTTALAAENHGTAVIGEIGGDRNGFGVTGIAPDARVSAAALNTLTTAQAIRQAADRLAPGDIILLEVHRAGPRFGFAGRGDQLGYVAIEWWPDDYAAIRYAVTKGVIVVEAAGNGAENLDDVLYDANPAAPHGPFPSWWRNPFRRRPLDAGAVVVGAGAPPPGTHGRDHGPDRSRLGFSNYGAVVDAQGWGREVTSTGYGDLQGGLDRNLWYTDTFSGTSSASPIVVGALACVQGALRARGRIPLRPARARELLRATGSPQQDAPGRPRTQRIGNRPNLRQLIPAALQQGSWLGVQFVGRLAPNQTQRWFTHSWPAHWHVVWTVVPTTPHLGAPQLRWQVMVERGSDAHVTYWLDIVNLVGEEVAFEARYAVLGW